tara:strand:- start:455 stop:769 length:315 start_codon:yes stop_codon:yes gene_type:complete
MNDFIQRVAARAHWVAFWAFALSTIMSLALIVGYPLGMEMPNDPIGEVGEMKDKIFMILLGITTVNLTILTVKDYSCIEPKKVRFTNEQIKEGACNLYAVIKSV